MKVYRVKNLTSLVRMWHVSYCMSVGYRFSHLSTVRDCRGMRICIPSVSEGRDENIHQKTRSRDGLKIESKEIFVSLKFIENNRENWTLSKNVRGECIFFHY